MGSIDNINTEYIIYKHSLWEKCCIGTAFLEAAPNLFSIRSSKLANRYFVERGTCHAVQKYVEQVISKDNR
jgi:hypothetical protein